MLPQLGQDERPFPIGHPEFPLTQLPARDGNPHGGIVRSAKAPNCSYFTNWRSEKDSIVWPAEVLADGRFQVEVYYTCPEDDVGATLELSFGAARLRGRVQTPHDPPLRGGSKSSNLKRGRIR